MALISVIIPAYNAERTVERTVRSVLASTIPLDVWVVDDGSTDGTGEILDRLVGEVSGSGTSESSVPLPNSHSSLQHSLKVIHQENCGCYQARLNALKEITTPYFGFADADDVVDPVMFERMLRFAEERELDVVQCGFDGEQDEFKLWPDGCVLGSREEVWSGFAKPVLVEGKGGGAFVWNKLYRNQYDFSAFDPTDRDTNFEDMIFNLQFFLKVERMGFLSAPLYHYAMIEGSAVHSFGENKLKDFREVVRVRRALLPRYGVDPDGEENRAWFKLNRMNCVKAAVRAGNLSVLRKMAIIRRLFMMGV